MGKQRDTGGTQEEEGGAGNRSGRRMESGRSETRHEVSVNIKQEVRDKKHEDYKNGSLTILL